MNPNQILSDFEIIEYGESLLIFYRVEEKQFISLSHFLNAVVLWKPKILDKLYFSVKLIEYFNFSIGLNIIEDFNFNIETQVIYMYTIDTNQDTYHKVTVNIE